MSDPIMELIEKLAYLALECDESHQREIVGDIYELSHSANGRCVTCTPMLAERVARIGAKLKESGL